MNNVNNERLEQFLDTAAEQIKTLMHERAEDIQKAWNETIEESHEAGKETLPPLKLGLAVVVDLEEEKVESTIRFNCVYTSKLSSKLPDPNQPDLDFEKEGGKA